MKIWHSNELNNDVFVFEAEACSHILNQNPSMNPVYKNSSAFYLLLAVAMYFESVSHTLDHIVHNLAGQAVDLFRVACPNHKL